MAILASRHMLLLTLLLLFGCGSEGNESNVITAVGEPDKMSNLEYIAILPEGNVLSLGSTSTNTAYGFNNSVSFSYHLSERRGDDVSEYVVWHSSDPTIFTVDNRGKITASSSKTGTAMLTASYGSVFSEPIEIVVTNDNIPTLVDLEVSFVNQLTNSQMPIGTLWQGQAFATFSDGSKENVTQSTTTTWQSGRESHFTIDNNVFSRFKGVFNSLSSYFSKNRYTVHYTHNGISKIFDGEITQTDPVLELLEVKSDACESTAQGSTAFSTSIFYCYTTVTPGDIIDINIWAVYDNKARVDISAFKSVLSDMSSAHFASGDLVFFNHSEVGGYFDDQHIAYYPALTLGEPIRILIKEDAILGNDYTFSVSFKDLNTRVANIFAEAQVVIKVR